MSDEEVRRYALAAAIVFYADINIWDPANLELQVLKFFLPGIKAYDEEINAIQQA